MNENVVFDHHLALAEGAVEQHALEGGLGLDQVGGDDHSLAGGEAVVFEHCREGARAHVVEGVFVAGEAAVACRGDVIFGHELLGELLAALDAGRGECVAEYLQSGGAELVDNSGCQRGFGADHGQVDSVLLGEFLQRGHVGVGYGHAFRLRGNSGIARGAPYLLHLLGAAQCIHYRMAASAAAHN